jgi:hypothetical protein
MGFVCVCVLPWRLELTTSESKYVTIKVLFVLFQKVGWGRNLHTYIHTYIHACVGRASVGDVDVKGR